MVHSLNLPPYAYDPIKKKLFISTCTQKVVLRFRIDYTKGLLCLAKLVIEWGILQCELHNHFNVLGFLSIIIILYKTFIYSRSFIIIPCYLQLYLQQ